MARTAKSLTNETHSVPLDQLRLAQRNPRKGNVGAVAASLSRSGQYRPLVVNIGTHTGRANEVLKGNHTLRALRQLAKKHPDDDRWSTALVHFVDVDDHQAAGIILSDNKTHEKGGYDRQILAGLLDDIDNTPEGLAGTGFTNLDLDGLQEESPVFDEDAYVDPDELPPDSGSGRGTPIISYSIIFDTAAEKSKWTDFIGWLKRQYPDLTLGERIVAYIETQAQYEGERSE